MVKHPGCLEKESLKMRNKRIGAVFKQHNLGAMAKDERERVS